MTADSPAILGRLTRLPRRPAPAAAHAAAARRRSSPGCATPSPRAWSPRGPASPSTSARLAEHLGVRHAVAVSSCTAGLMLVFDRFRGADGVHAQLHLHGDGHGRRLGRPHAGLRRHRPRDVVPRPGARRGGAHRPTRALDRAGARLRQPGRQRRRSTTIGRRRGVAIVYDAAHGFGALRDGAPGRRRQGLAQVFSTSPTKLLITGEGGVVATDDDELAERVVVGREYGNPGDYDPALRRLQRPPARDERAARPRRPRPARARGASAATPWPPSTAARLGGAAGHHASSASGRRTAPPTRTSRAHPRRRVRPHARRGGARRSPPRASTRAPTTCRRCTASGPSPASVRLRGAAAARRRRSATRSSPCPTTAS